MYERNADTFIARLQDDFKTIRATLGADLQDPTTTYGPLVDRTQCEKVFGYISEGKKDTEILRGGKFYDLPCRIVQGTLVRFARAAALGKASLQ